jgi:hypothetical protein
MIDVVRNEEGKMKHLKFEGVLATPDREPAVAGSGGSAPSN